jgi:hypothetical protein
MNQDTLIDFLREHGPIKDHRPTRANAIKKAWEISQQMLDEHPEYKVSNASWFFHVKNLEKSGRVVVERKSSRISTRIDLAPATREELGSPHEVQGALEPEVSTEPEKVAEIPSAAELPSVPDIKPVDLSNEPLVRVSVELPASRAAQILADLSELPPPAALEPSQIAVLIEGYRQMTDQLQNFVSETFAAWLEMTEKIDRIESLLQETTDDDPIVMDLLPEMDGDSDGTEKKDKTVKPRLSAVPSSVTDKDLRNLYGTVAAQGYTLERSGGGHVKMIPQNGNGTRTLIGPSTPSDHRSIKNLRAQLRRAGVEL